MSDSKENLEILLGERKDDCMPAGPRPVLPADENPGGCAFTDVTLPDDADEAIDLTLPSMAALMALVRFTAATLASRAQFSVEEIEDLRLAADELCLSTTDRARIGPMHLHFSRKGGTIEISCTVTASAVPAPPWGGDDPEGEWSARILDALVSEHGRETKSGQCRAWVRKCRVPTTV
jgi:serine/threonine-protein kinase RsbW